MTKALAYLRTSSATNVGADKDSDKRQLAAIQAYAAANGIEIIASYYDAAVSGADPVTERPGFARMLDHIAGNGVRMILVESPDRFARDLTVQLIGHDHLKAMGIALVPTTAPTFFTEETPTAVMVRQILGAVAQFEKASLVAKLRAARERTGRLGGMPSIAERRPEVIDFALSLRQSGATLKEIAEQLTAAGHLTSKGKPFAMSHIHTMLKGE
jgi:DNA invertase Pin-like site-specific DNA recombinase